MKRFIFFLAGLIFYLNQTSLAQDWQPLYNQLLNEYKSGNFQEITRQSANLTAQAEKEFGKASKPYAYTCKLVSGACYESGLFSDGIRSGLEEIKYLPAVIDTNTVEFSNSLHTLGLNYLGNDEPEPALFCFRRSEKILFINPGPASEAYAEILSEIGQVNNNLSRSDSAGYYFEKSLKVYETLDNLPGSYLVTLLESGKLYLANRQYDIAYERALMLNTLLKDNGMINDSIFGESMLIAAEASKGKMDISGAERMYSGYILFLGQEGRTGSSEYSYAVNELGKLYKSENNIKSFDSLLTANKDILKGSASGGESPMQEYLNLAVIYQNQRQFDKADKAYEDAFELIKSGQSVDKVSEGLLYENYALLHYAKRDYNKALQSSDQAVRIFQSNEIKPQYRASAYNTRGMVYKGMGRMDSAKVNFLEAASVCSGNNLGNTEIQAKILENLSSLELLKGNTSEARNYIEKAIKLRADLNGVNSYSYANSLNSYGAVLNEMSNYSQAIEVLEKSLKIADSLKNKDESLFLQVITNLGLIYYNIGNNATADSIFALSVKETSKVYGEGSIEAGKSLINLARADQALGNYKKAESEYLLALKNIFAIAGENDPEYLNSYNSFGKFYQTLGNYEEAERIYKEIIGKVSPGDPVYPIALQNLATLYQMQEKYELAEPLLVRDLGLDSLQKGTDKNPDYAISLQNLASLYQKTGRLELAVPLYLKALKIDESVYGKIHPSYSKKLFNLATLYQDQGKYNEALPLMKESVEIRKTVFGQDHPDYAYGQFGLAVINDAIGNDAEARLGYNEAARIYLKQLKEIFPALSEKEKTAFYNRIRPIIEDYRDFAVEYAATDPSVLKDLYNLQLQTKAILLNASAKTRSRIMNSGDPDLISRYNTWISIKEQIVRMYGFTREELVKQGVDLQTLERSANDLEKELSEKSELFAGEIDKSEVNWENIRSILKPGESAIEIIRISKNIKNDSVIYAGLVITQNTIDHPVLVIFPNGIKMETREYSRYLNSIKFKIQNEASYKIYWKPFESVMTGIKKVFVSSDGIFNKINLNTLYDPDSSSYLIDQFKIILVSNTKDLLTEKKAPGQNQNIAELLGFPDYKMGIAGNQPEIDKTQNGSGISDLLRSGVSPLPGTRDEVELIQQVLNSNNWHTTLLTGAEADENNLKKIHEPGILHLATHGFFLNDVELKRNLGEDNQLMNEAMLSNPLLRSGVLLAGAERGAYHNPNDAAQPNETSDGILTAYEAMNLNLDNSRLVVLSACETGLGELKNGEGIYGLQRAFLVAGASNLVMSLWKVNDATTQELMTGFYKTWLSGKTLTDAFRETQLVIKQKYPFPYYWGAFIMIGE
jgi:CHAT domain-containing protein/tetratricopeptide (TPR) repeat protein